MLHGKIDAIKGYEELLIEAIGQIPVYSDEWTNYNPSDPGITILENLTAFHQIQMESIEAISQDAKKNLLKLVGFISTENIPSKIFVEMPENACNITLPAHKKMAVGKLMFETVKPIQLKEKELLSVHTISNDKLKNVTGSLNPKLPLSVAPFGLIPQVGDGFCVAITSLPPCGKALTLYIQTQDRFHRNHWQDDNIPPFATLSWQIFTNKGWVNITVLDETGFFLKSGKITLVMPSVMPIEGGYGLDGYVVRCIVLETRYDTPPHIHAIFDNMFEVCQRDTMVASFAKGGNLITIHSEMVDYDIFQVFVQEAENQKYRLYKQAPLGGGKGLFYHVKQRQPGKLVLEFDANCYGHEPCHSASAVRVVCYTEESINLRALGRVYGYDNQKITIDGITSIVSSDFQVMAETVGLDGELEYDFYQPNLTDENMLGYHLNAEDGILEIYNPGVDGDCKLFLSDCAVTLGANGNLRNGNRLTTIPNNLIKEEPITFVGIGNGEQGKSYESTKVLAEAFSSSLKKSCVAVTVQDYEDLVKNTPGLCIEAVKATIASEENVVKIAVKPQSNQKFPSLSNLYLEEIQRHIEKSRLITTRVIIVQPRYIPIHFRVKLQVKEQIQQEDIHQQLIQIFMEIFDESNLGASLSLKELYQAVNRIKVVAYLHEITPVSYDEAGIDFDGTWIHLQPDCMGYLGHIQIQLVW